MATDWYPRVIADRIPWHTNFNTQAVATGVARGLTSAQVSQITTDLNTVTVVVDALEAADDFAQAVTAYKDIVLDGALGVGVPTAPTPPAAISIGAGGLPSVQARTRQYAALIKAQPTYTDAIGELYGIVAPAETGPAAPSLRARSLPGTGNVELSIAKGGFDVIAIDMRRGGGAWDQIGVSQRAVFIDTTPALVVGQPEVREYRAQGMLNNARTGDLSATVSAVTVP